MTTYKVGDSIENVGTVQTVDGKFVTVCSEYAYRSAKHDIMDRLGFDHVGPQVASCGCMITTYQMRDPLPPYRFREGEKLPNGPWVDAVTEDFVTLGAGCPLGANTHQYMLGKGYKYVGPTTRKNNGDYLVTYQKIA